MARISEQTIEQIRSAADIVDVVSGYVELKKRGRNFFGLCPFHNEKTPSFSVNQERQIFKCFGCGAGGGSINFIMELEKLEFIDAIRHLAEQYGIHLEIEDVPGQSRDLISQLMDIHEKTAHYYLKNLATEEGADVLAHLHERGLNKETIKKFKLGYSMDSYDKLLKQLQEGKYNTDSLAQCGLILSNKRGYLDRFRGRIMFSITNVNGKVIAFAGRVFKKDDPAKYVNSPETPIYAKSKVLYGLWASKESIRETEVAVVVEGYLDYLQLYQAGITNIVAISGTSLTDGHATLLKRFCKKVILAYDGDKAGISAAIRAGYILLKHDLDVRIMNIPEGMDPDDWIKSEGPEPFIAAQSTAPMLLEFHKSKTGHDLSNPTGMSNFINHILTELATMEEPISRELQARSLAALCCVSEESIFQTLSGLIQKNVKRAKFKQSEITEKTVEAKIPSSPLRLVEEELIQLCFVPHADMRKLIFESMNGQLIHDQSLKRIFEEVYIHLNSEKEPNASIIMNELKNEDDRRRLSALVFDLENITPSIHMVGECIKRLEDHWVKLRLNKLREKLKHDNGSHDDHSQIIVEIAELQNRLKREVNPREENAT